MSEPSFREQWLEADHARHGKARTDDLNSLVMTLIQRNFELTTLVATLVDTLAESEVHLDVNVLLAKVDGQLDVEVPKPKAAPAAKAAPVPTTACSKCGTVVPLKQAEMTANGLICASCAARGA